MLTKAKTIVKYFSKSTKVCILIVLSNFFVNFCFQASTKLALYQEKNGYPQHVLERFSKTRFSFAVPCLSRLVEQRIPVTVVLEELSWDGSRLSQNEWELMQALSQLCTPLVLALERFERENTVTISEVLPFLFRLQVLLGVAPVEMQDVAAFKCALWDGFRKRVVGMFWRPTPNSLSPLPLLWKAMMLDTRFHTMWPIADAPLKDHAYRQLQAELEASDGDVVEQGTLVIEHIKCC
jgi:hypothetical protein